MNSETNLTSKKRTKVSFFLKLNSHQFSEEKTQVSDKYILLKDKSSNNFEKFSFKKIFKDSNNFEIFNFFKHKFVRFSVKY